MHAERRGLLISKGWVQAVILVVLFGFFVLGLLAYRTYEAKPPIPERAVGPSGAVLYTEYAYPFQLAAVVLLISIVAAITLTMRRRPGLKVQDIVKQVAVRREDRVRIVKVEPSKEP